MNDTLKTMLIVAAAAAGVYLVYKLWHGAGAAVEAVNPVNPDNIFSEGAGAVSSALGGSGSLGSDIYNWFHPTDSGGTPVPFCVGHPILCGGA